MYVGDGSSFLVNLSLSRSHTSAIRNPTTNENKTKKSKKYTATYRTLSLLVSKLRAELEKRGLSSEGFRADLVQRLRLRLEEEEEEERSGLLVEPTTPAAAAGTSSAAPPVLVVATTTTTTTALTTTSSTTAVPKNASPDTTGRADKNA
jgi:hypothetical protein